MHGSVSRMPLCRWNFKHKNTTFFNKTLSLIQRNDKRTGEFMKDEFVFCGIIETVQFPYFLLVDDSGLYRYNWKCARHEWRFQKAPCHRLEQFYQTGVPKTHLKKEQIKNGKHSYTHSFDGTQILVPKKRNSSLFTALQAWPPVKHIYKFLYFTYL